MRFHRSLSFQGFWPRSGGTGLACCWSPHGGQHGRGFPSFWAWCAESRYRCIFAQGTSFSRGQGCLISHPPCTLCTFGLCEESSAETWGVDSSCGPDSGSSSSIYIFGVWFPLERLGKVVRVQWCGSGSAGGDRSSQSSRRTIGTASSFCLCLTCAAVGSL